MFAKFVPRMTNKELNGLAQNRFIDEETQCAIASHKYLLCRKYLAMNPELKPSAIDILTNSKANSIKWLMIQYCNLNDQPETISKLWEQTTHSFRIPWRVGQTFIAGSYHQALHGVPNTPVETLKDIYLSYYRPREVYTNSWQRPEYWCQRLLEHPNVNEELAMIMSTTSIPALQKKAFEKLVQLRRSK